MEHFRVCRFRDTVTGQFYGHTHYDDVQIFYDKDSQPFNVAYVGPSVTPFVGINPAYRVYTMDADTKPFDPTETHNSPGVLASSKPPCCGIICGRFAMPEVLDYTTHYLDLLSANAFDQPRWLELYSAKTAYKMDDLSPKSWSSWVSKLIWSNDAFQTHYRHFHRNSQFFRQCNDKECKRERLCTIVTADTSDPTPCLRIVAELERYYFLQGVQLPNTVLLGGR
ncbi:unnamed protein product [Notodromas monacha]|uniref:Sphingomyelin phosphodiesterase C-terminal domain-containing protein n=1 Tax=Notodromas monacha TaxID=399045 RepID=A0A7R9G8Q6_9CRUS|nr:unnamed protein product [Notodromas monacha]CAG0912348.1 unnamed protein product [Notodromas monacha]